MGRKAASETAGEFWLAPSLFHDLAKIGGRTQVIYGLEESGGAN
jgi:hypothetical protein